LLLAWNHQHETISDKREDKSVVDLRLETPELEEQAHRDVKKMADVSAVNTVVDKPTDEDVQQENQHNSAGFQVLP